jgi:hypothetical protein
MTTTARGASHKVNVAAGTIRAPKRSGKTGTGFSGARAGAQRTWSNKMGAGMSPKRVRKGAIHSQNRYS